MSRICDLTGKTAISGNHVSFSQRKTKRKFKPNLHKKRFYLQKEDKWITMNVSTTGLRTISKLGLAETLKKYAEKGTLSSKVKKQL